MEEALVVVIVDLFHARHVAGESRARKQAIETLAELDMVLAIQKHPVGLSEKFVSGIDDTGLDIGRRVENLAGHVTSRSDNNESKYTVSN